MTTLITRKLEYDDRVALQQADQAIRKDVVRALVELITNSNDSYHRLEDGGHQTSGTITIEVQRRHKNPSMLRVRDCAEGMSSDDMDRMVGTYGAATSGFIKGKSVRGLWGRGLKDAFFGLGHGDVYSFHDRRLHRCSLVIRNHAPTFVKQQPITASRVLRKQHDVKSGNGTILEIVVSRSDVPVPQFDNLRRSLERHFELRAIMSNPGRHVLLRELGSRGKVRQEVALRYVAPVGVQVLDETIEVPGFPAQCHLEVYRSEEPLSTPAEEQEYADGGLVVVSKRIVLGLTLLKFENNEYASRFYGRMTCDYLHDLLAQEQAEPVLTATRDGINWKHQFTRALRLAVEAKLDPLVEAERRRIEEEERPAIDGRVRKRLDDALKELNSIAAKELGPLDGQGDVDKPNSRPVVPSSGFGFVPEATYVQAGKVRGLTLRATVPEKIANRSLVTFESDSPEVTVLTPQAVIEERGDYPGVGQAIVLVEGRQVGVEAVVTARSGDIEAVALVRVISKREPDPRDPTLSKSDNVLVRGYKFDGTAEPKQRAYFARASSQIVIATRAPSVSAYFDEVGSGIETPQGQVMLSELITETVCREIARRGVQSGNFIAVKGAETDAIQREYIRLQNNYAHVIHACYVDPENQRNGCPRPAKKRGRPKRNTTQ